MDTIAVGPDGSFAFGGTVVNDIYSAKNYLTRVGADGALDTTFGTNGYIREYGLSAGDLMALPNGTYARVWMYNSSAALVRYSADANWTTGEGIGCSPHM